MKKRMLSAFLSMCMMLTMVPAAFAAEPEQNETYSVSTAEALEEAIDQAVAGDTIELTADIEVPNTGVPSYGAAVTLPAGVTLDGKDYSISPDTTWTTATHIISVVGAAEGTSTVIKNLTVTGNNNTKSGIHVYNSKGVTLKDVTIQNCAEAGLLVNGSAVTATGLITSGNGWGGLNVDKGSNVTIHNGCHVYRDVPDNTVVRLPR